MNQSSPRGRASGAVSINAGELSKNSSAAGSSRSALKITKSRRGAGWVPIHCKAAYTYNSREFFFALPPPPPGSFNFHFFSLSLRVYISPFLRSRFDFVQQAARWRPENTKDRVFSEACFTLIKNTSFASLSASLLFFRAELIAFL